MRAPVLLVAIAGCGFSPAGSSPTDSAGSTMHADGPMSQPDVAPVGSDAPHEIGPPCFAPDSTGLVLCLELDDQPFTVAKDGSGKAHDATVSNATTMTRDVPTTSQAAVIAIPTTIETAYSTDFDLAAFTLMAWVDRTDTPTETNTYGLVEDYGQYLSAIDAQGNFECIVQASNGDVLTAPGPAVPESEWTLTACTYDGTQLCGYVWPGGSGSTTPACTTMSPTLATAVGRGILIGARYDGEEPYNHLIGGIDSARIFDHALTGQQICTGGGRSGC
jgi:hypothetical protein